MSQPKRYDCGMTEESSPSGIITRWPLMHSHPAGKYVLHSDYAALAADYVEVKDLHLKCRIDIGNLHKENERLKAEVEWLRKADRLVCWNPATEQWEIRHESPR